MVTSNVYSAPAAVNEGVIVSDKVEKESYTHASAIAVEVLAKKINGVHINGNSSATSKPVERDGCSDVLQTHPAYQARRLRIVTIGAGYSGMILAHKLRYQHASVGELVDNTIYESRPQVGGTWLVNNYPGVQCDVPAHIYAFPFDPNPEWDRFYATGAQIQEYFVKTVRKWDLDRDVQLNTKVVGLHWQEDRCQWKVTVENQLTKEQSEQFADLVFSAQGFLNTWQWPTIPGLENFQGKKVHSAAWDHDYDYSHQRIAVIGNGSSGIQILPEMAKLPGTQVTSFQRGPTWVVSRMDPGRLLGKRDAGPNPVYTAEEKRRFRVDPKAHNAYRKQLIHRTNQAFGMVS